MDTPIRLEEFGKQLKALERTLGFFKVEEDSDKRISLRSAVIKDFELAYELCWKAAQELANFEDAKVYKPKEAVRFLLEIRILEDSALFEAMIDSRNRTTHVYGEGMLESLLPLIEHDFAGLLTQLNDAILRYYSERRA
jgi:nucleotidyltransferase substrate binding protein (TIGR01987 family)